MNAMTGTIGQTAPWSPARTYALEAKYEFLKVLRMPGYAVPSIAFPAMFYLLFGVFFGRQAVGGVSMSTYLIATYGAFGVIGASLFGFGVGVAIERGQGWLMLKRASPMPPIAFFVAKLAMCTIFAATVVLVLATLGVTLGNVRMPGAMWLRLASTLVLGAIPFCALGLGLGYLVGPNAAPPIVNLIYLPMSFLTGLWIPFEVLPPAVKAVAPFLPAFHLGQLALGAIGTGAGTPAWSHVAALAGFTMIGLGLALWGYRREEDRGW
jgi:ABC-2 type transport system permease protein